MSDRNDPRLVSQKKAAKFKELAQDYLKARKHIPTGHTHADEIQRTKRRILEVLGGTDEDWNDWHWQLRNRIGDAQTLGKIFDLTEKEMADITKVEAQFRWGVSPHYASLMNPSQGVCPIWRQMIPSIEELAMTGIPDFSGEEFTSPAKALVRWYPDRVTIYSTNLCSSFCRHCLRRRHFGEVDKPTPDADILEALDYIRANPEIRDVLYTGGDPLTFGDDKVDWLLTELGKIEHVEIKRIGSRMPVTVPQRITPQLCEILAKHHPLYINVHFNHPKEVTPEAARACDMLARAGVPLGNQTVLMNGVNDNHHVMKVLSHELLKIRVRPYYIYHCQGTLGIAHLRTPVETGIEIVENLRGYTSGLGVPSYIITPAGLGKTPLAPSYQISAGDGFVWLRNWEGRAYKYDNPQKGDES
ncbi:KamA family radical SAM protein [Myxococcota bacterium]